MTKYLHLLTDYAFKRIFGTEKNKKILIKFLNAIVDERDKIIDVTFRDKEALPFIEEGKRMVFDIYCLTHDHRHIIVEMQRNPQPTFAERTLMYCSHAMLKQLLPGTSYDLDPVYGIFLMDFHLPGHQPKMVRRVGLTDAETGEIFTDKLKMIYLDLRMMQYENLEDCKSEIEEWLFLIKNLWNMKNHPKDYPDYKDLFDAADVTSMAAEDVVAYSHSLRKLNDDHEGLLYYGRQQHNVGRAEGRAEGVRETLTAMMRSLKAKGLKEDEIEGLMKSEEILRLLDKEAGMMPEI